MQIAQTAVQKCPITQGIVKIARKQIKVGAVVFAPPRGWKPADGPEALVPLTIEKVYEDVALAKDGNGEAWGFWL